MIKQLIKILLGKSLSKLKLLMHITCLHIIAIFLKFNGVRIIIEIGCFKGVSTSIWLKYFEKVYAVDPWLPGYDINDVASHIVGSEIEKEFDK